MKGTLITVSITSRITAHSLLRQSLLDVSLASLFNTASIMATGSRKFDFQNPVKEKLTREINRR
jgi:hypothetical protein